MSATPDFFINNNELNEFIFNINHNPQKYFLHYCDAEVLGESRTSIPHPSTVSHESRFFYFSKTEEVYLLLILSVKCFTCTTISKQWKP